MNAIFALSSAHLEYRGIENEEKSLDFHNKALQGLAQLIEQNECMRIEKRCWELSCCSCTTKW
jgi:hypothetical protein